MPSIERIHQMLFSVIEELNRMLPSGEHMPKDVHAPLMGASGRLDSAGLINLIVLTEQRALQDLGRDILLTDDGTLSRIEQVFGTVGSLADHIHGLLHEKTDG